MSTAIPLLGTIALVAAIALCGVGIWAAIEVAKAAQSTRRLTDDLDERIVPLTEKVDVSVDALNAELLRVDMIVDQVEDAVDRFTGTAETVREVVDAPIHLVNEMADRFRKGMRRRSRERQQAHTPPPPEDTDGAVTVVIGEPEEEPSTVSDVSAPGEAAQDDSGEPIEPDAGPDVETSPTNEPEEA